MTAVDRATRRRVKRVMEECVEEHAPKLERWNDGDIWQAYPFHRLFFTNEGISAARAERSIVTSMGTSLYPRLAVAIARERFQDIITEHTIEGDLNDDACNLLEQIVTELREARRGRQNPRNPDHAAEINSIINTRGGDRRRTGVIADLYIGDFTGGPLFIELKTPLPNLDIAAESKRKMLYFLAIMDRRSVTGAKAFLGLTYHPFITRENYKHSFTRRIMDMENEVLIGSELWNYIGGQGTYDELLEIIEEINPA